MGVLRMYWFVVLVTLLCGSLVPVSSREGYRKKKKIDNVLLELLVDPVIREMGEGMAELSSNADETNTGSHSLEKENVQRILRVMHPQSKRNLLLPESGEKVASMHGLIDPDVRRRKLGNELIRHTSRVSASTSPPTSSRNSTIVIAVAVTALVAFLIAAVCACFYFKLCGGDKPLLRLSSSSPVKEGVLVQDGKVNSLPPEQPADPMPLPGGPGPPPSLPGQSGTPPPPTSGQSGTPPQPTPGQLGTPPPPTLGQSGTPPPPPGQLGTPPPPALGQSGTPPPALDQSGTSSSPTLGQFGTSSPLSLGQSGTSPAPPPGQSGTSPLPTLGQSGTPPPPPGQSGTPPPSPPGQSVTSPPPPGPNDGPLPPPSPAGIPRPPQSLGYGRVPFGQKQSSNSSSGEAELEGKTKLKPFFWDKVQANPDNSMVWHQLKDGSFQFNEEKIETLFGFARTEAAKKAQDPADQFVRIIDPKKAQNLAILLRALNVTTEDACDAILEGNELPPELLHTLLKMAPTAEEELKLRLFSGEVSQLGPAERFLKALVDIPFAFKRLESLLFMGSFQDEVAAAKEAFATLEVATNELKNSRLFLKLLEAVLKTGNRMNDGTFRGGADAFKLDTLLKLSDVKGTDGKTTLLHFVVQEIIRTEGLRASRVAITNSDSDDNHHLLGENDDSEEYYRNIGLQVVSGLGGELKNVKKAATIDAEALTGTVARLGQGLLKARGFLNSEMKNVDDGFRVSLESFVEYAEGDAEFLLAEERRIAALVKSAGDYFHGDRSGKSEGFRLFSIVRDFLIMLDKACKEVKERPTKEALGTSRAERA